MKKSSKKRSSWCKNPYREKLKRQIGVPVYSSPNFIIGYWYIISDSDPEDEVRIRIAQFDHFNQFNEPIFDLYNSKKMLAPIAIFKNRYFIGPFHSYENALTFAHNKFPGLYLFDFKSKENRISVYKILLGTTKKELLYSSRI